MDKPAIAKYRGGLKNGRPHGTGTIVYTDGSLYSGEFVDGRIEGNGEIRFANGNIYRGQMKDDKRHGYGTFEWVDGEKYEGLALSSILAISPADLISLSKLSRSTDFPPGSFESDMRSGYGTYFYSNGEKYEGQFWCGMKHGKGKFWFNSKHRSGQDLYEGEFKNGVRR